VRNRTACGARQTARSLQSCLALAAGLILDRNWLSGCISLRQLQSGSRETWQRAAGFEGAADLADYGRQSLAGVSRDTRLSGRRPRSRMVLALRTPFPKRTSSFLLKAGVNGKELALYVSQLRFAHDCGEERQCQCHHYLRDRATAAGCEHDNLLASPIGWSRRPSQFVGT